jgi:hypothetical protein
MNATEAIYGFMGWLTCREEAVTFGSSHDAAKAAELCKEWCEANKLPDVSDAWPNNIVHPKSPA